MVAANVLNAVVLVAALSFRPLSAAPYIWSSVLFLYMARLARGLYARRGRAPPTVASCATIHRAIAHAGALGAIWGAAPILFFDSGEGGQLIVACVCAGMLCGGSFALATIPAAVVAYTLPIAVGCLIGFVRGAHEPVHYLAAPLIFCYVAALLWAAISHGRQFADRVVAQVRAELAARHDALTGLPNRSAFEAALDSAFQRLERYGERFALLYIDLDDFKGVNDRLGHQAGDHLLRQVAGRLASGVRDREMVARLGGDEFALLACGAADALSAAGRGDQMAQYFEAPFTLEGATAHCRPSIGIALAPADGADPVSLIRHADAALYKAKRDRNKAVHFYRAAEDREAHDQRELAHDFVGAVDRGEFFLHYQPIHALESERIVACEALVRWRHPRRGLVSPAQFIAIAEHSSAIHEIGEWVMFEACAEATTWPEPICLAINVSAAQICDHSINRVVESALRRTGLPPQRLQIEVAESALLAQIQGTASTLARLHDQGVSIVLDDFGTGYSSFDHIRRLPVRGLKIDRSFVADLPFDRKSGAIVHAVAHLARTLELEVTAEGIETEAQLEFLRLARCNSGQGYLFAPPLRRDALKLMINAPPPRVRKVA